MLAQTPHDFMESGEFSSHMKREKRSSADLGLLSQQEKKGRGLRRALIGLAAIAAGGFAVMHARH